jgi:5'(3')-deoxyribonucleotidase
MRLFVDQDHTIADFDEAFRRITGLKPYPYRDKFIATMMKNGLDKDEAIYKWEQDFWGMLDIEPKFWETIPTMPGFPKLKKVIMELNPSILTAVPHYTDAYIKAKQGKRKWIDKHLSTDVPLYTITLDPKDHRKMDKAIFCENKNDILIDDNKLNVKAWCKKGGKAILYTNVDSTINQLKKILKEISE